MEKTTRRHQMAQLIEAHANSGMTKQAFCRQQGINPATFYYWQRRLREQCEAGFQQIVPVHNYEIQVQICGGKWIGLRSHSLSTLKGVLEAICGEHA